MERYQAALDASDTGTGKTVTALAIARAFGVTPLVVGPKSSEFSWRDISAAMEVPVEFINYEKLKKRSKDSGNVETDYLREVPWGSGSFIEWRNSYDFMIFDEIHRCGGGTTLNSKMLIGAKRKAGMVLGLSATAADDPRQMKALGYMLGLHGLSKKTRTMPDFMGWMYRHGVTPGVFGGFEFTSDPEKQEKAFLKLHGEIFPSRGARMLKTRIPNFPKTVIDLKLVEDTTGKATKLQEAIHENDDIDSLVERGKLEDLKAPVMIDMAKDAVREGNKVVVFVNFTAPLEEIFFELEKHFGPGRVGRIDGSQTGEKGRVKREDFLNRFRADEMDALVCNAGAASESMSMHGHAPRVTLISPMESARRLEQVFGRVNRDGGGFSTQYIVAFKGSYEEVVYGRVKQRGFNLSLFNDGDLKL